VRLAGLLLMPAGWVLVASAISLLPSLPGQTAFVLAGFGVELLGFVLVARSHLPPKASRHAQ
jgi:hypothetical protein